MHSNWPRFVKVQGHQRTRGIEYRRVGGVIPVKRIKVELDK